MTDIFLSYTEKDREQARRVAALLESVGWTVWWDRRIPAGETWRTVLAKALETTHCMIVLWSAHSIESEWVCEEASEGRRLGKLVPVLIEDVRPPAGFREIQAADLTNWDGSREFEGMRMLVADLERLLGKPVPGATDIPKTSSDHGHPYDPADRAGGATTTDRWKGRGLSAIAVVGALLLAAGAGRRMGGPKALLRLTPTGPTLIESAVERLWQAGCDRVVTVLGAGASQASDAVAHLRVDVVTAPDWGEGMGASLRAGLADLSSVAPQEVAADIALVTLVDLPDVTITNPSGPPPTPTCSPSS